VGRSDRDIARDLRAISNCNQALLRATDEQTLLDDVCRIICEDAGYRMAWVGFAQHDPARSVRIVAQAGEATDYLDGISVSWADVPDGRGPTGVAIREGRTAHISSFGQDESVAVWRERALAHDFRCSIALPLKSADGAAFGALMIYSADDERFEDDEIALLEELANDLAFGIDTLRTRHARADAERGLEASEALFRTAFRESPNPMVISRLDTGEILETSQAAARLLRTTRENLIGKTPVEAGIFPDQATRDVLRDELVRVGLLTERPIVMHDVEGAALDVLISASITTIDGVECILTFVRDVTAQLQADARLRASQELQRATFEQAAAGIARFSLDGRFIDLNERFAQILGYPIDELRQLTWREVTHPDDLPGNNAMVESLLAEPTMSRTTEKRYLAKDGSMVWALLAISAMRDDNGSPVNIIAVIDDITERRLAEETLEKKSRALRALSHVNEALVRAEEEQTLLDRVCQAVSSAGYPLVWVAFGTPEPGSSIDIVSAAGSDLGYLELVRGHRAMWSEDPALRSPTEICLTEARPVAIRRRDVTFDSPEIAAAAQRLSFEAALALPLVDSDGHAFGALAINARDEDAFDDDELALLTEMASDLSYGIGSLRSRDARDRALADLRTSNQRLHSVMHDVVLTMGKIVETRDPYTQGHQQRVARVAALIAEEMGLSARECAMIEGAALVHDVGKLSVPAEILNRPGSLNQLEFDIIKQHSKTGSEILRNVAFEDPIADIVLQHHERMDGSGYPHGLRGDEIILPARVIMVADVVEAIASHRPYRAALGLDVAMVEIVSHPEKYDADVVAACVRLHEQGRLDLDVPELEP